jgi:hypothetical protein
LWIHPAWNIPCTDDFRILPCCPLDIYPITKRESSPFPPDLNERNFTGVMSLSDRSTQAPPSGAKRGTRFGRAADAALQKAQEQQNRKPDSLSKFSRPFDLELCLSPHSFQTGRNPSRRMAVERVRIPIFSHNICGESRSSLNFHGCSPSTGGWIHLYTALKSVPKEDLSWRLF